jgi:hypothetical protein
MVISPRLFGAPAVTGNDKVTSTEEPELRSPKLTGKEVTLGVLFNIEAVVVKPFAAPVPVLVILNTATY